MYLIGAIECVYRRHQILRSKTKEPLKVYSKEPLKTGQIEELKESSFLHIESTQVESNFQLCFHVLLETVFARYQSRLVHIVWLPVNGKCKLRLRVVPPSLSPSCMTRKKTARKMWPREILSRERRPQDFAQPCFFPRFSFASGTTDWAKEGLLVV